MNKKKFVEFIRTPEEMSVRDLSELQKVINEAPYFQSAYTVMAKGCRLLNQKAAPVITKRAAIYATNRDVFKDYLINSTKPKPVSHSAQPVSKSLTPSATAKPTTAAKLPAGMLNPSEHERLINEIYDNLEQWKSNREHYLEFDKEHPGLIIIEEATPQAPEEKSNFDSVELLKNLVADEVQAEEKEASNTVDEILLKNTATDEVPILNEISSTGYEAEAIDQEVIEETEPVIEGPMAESPEAELPRSIYSFRNKIPEPEPIPEKGPEMISSEELSAIVDETEAAINIEVDENEGPVLESIDEISSDELAEGLGTPIIEKVEIVEEKSYEQEPKDGLGLIHSHDDVMEIAIPEQEETSSEPKSDSRAKKKPSKKEKEVTPDPEVVSEQVSDSHVDSVEKQEVDEDEVVIDDVAFHDDISSSGTENVVSDIEHQKEELKLLIGNTSKTKKFRLSVLKRPIKFTKPKKTSAPKSRKKADSVIPIVEKPAAEIAPIKSEPKKAAKKTSTTAEDPGSSKKPAVKKSAPKKADQVKKKPKK